MIAIGNYFVFVISVIRVIYAVPWFSCIEKGNFYEEILKEHNTYRKTHGSNDLLLKHFAFMMAEQYLKYFMTDILEEFKIHTVNTFSMKLSDHSKLDSELAKQIVACWYETGKDYKYDVDPTSRTADPFIRIVWRYTTQLGVRAEVKDDNLYVVAYYHYFDVKEHKYIDNVKKPSDNVNENLNIK